MNTYNENLQNTVLASLQSQYMDQKNLNAQYNASKFTLYYAQGATITASDRLALAMADQATKALVKEQATHSNNIAANLLSSATQADQYVGQSISNAAICAANVQIAATAVTRLASDVGSIFSIVNAADFDTDIYTLTNEVKGLVDETAYLAEYTSQIAMDASTQTSSVTAATVLDNTKTTTAQMSGLLQIAAAGFDTSCQVVTADDATLASARALEKNAEGTIECIGIDYDSSKAAYECINLALNMDLRVYLAYDKHNGTASGPADATTFKVTFQPLKSPFPKDSPSKGLVENYYILIVKDSKKLVFTLSEAESIVLNENNERQFVAVDPASVDAKGNLGATINYLKFKPEGKRKDAKDKENATEKKEANDQHKELAPMLDTDGKAIAAGQNYVAFVVAVYTNDYKRKINNFDDFLSVPSQAFCLTQHLAPAQNVKLAKIDTSAGTVEDNQIYQQKFRTALDRTLKSNVKLASGIDNGGKLDDLTHQITFDVMESVSAVEYRCMLLPASDIDAGLLSANAFKAFFAFETILVKVSSTYDPKITKYQKEVSGLELQLQQVSDDNNKNELQNKLNRAKDKVIALQNEKAHKLQAGINVTKGGPGFLFDLALAEQVSSGNFIPAVLYAPEADDSAKRPEEDSELVSRTYIAYAGEATTDNFGNMLIKGNKYLPVVLSVSTAVEENQAQYTNAISDLNKITPVTY